MRHKQWLLGQTNPSGPTAAALGPAWLHSTWPASCTEAMHASWQGPDDPSMPSQLQRGQLEVAAQQADEQDGGAADMPSAAKQQAAHAAAATALRWQEDMKPAAEGSAEGSADGWGSDAAVPSPPQTPTAEASTAAAPDPGSSSPRAAAQTDQPQGEGAPGGAAPAAGSSAAAEVEELEGSKGSPDGWGFDAEELVGAESPRPPVRGHAQQPAQRPASPAQARLSQAPAQPVAANGQSSRPEVCSLHACWQGLCMQACSTAPVHLLAWLDRAEAAQMQLVQASEAESLLQQAAQAGAL